MHLLLPAFGAITVRNLENGLKRQEASINKLKAGVRMNSYETDKLNQYGRRENIRIAGIKEDVADENLKTEVARICSSLGVVLQPDDYRCHRLGVKSANSVKPRQVIVRFMNRETRNRVMDAKKDLHTKAEYKHLFIFEDLTALRFKLLNMVRNHDDVKTAFTRDGKIHAYMKNGEKKTVDSPDDLFKIGFTNINYNELGLADLD